MEDLITKIVLEILKYFSRKEGDVERRGHEYENANNFSVHAPKWIIPLIIVSEFFFGGMAIFSYFVDLKRGIPVCIAFCVLCFIALMCDLVFRIEIDGQQIAVTRLFRGTKFFHCRDIISVRRDNSGGVIALVGTEKIHIDPTMVNKDEFFNFARNCAWSNIDSGVRQSYKIYRNKTEYLLITGAFLLVAVFAAFCLPDFKNFILSEKLVVLPIVLVLAVGLFLYLSYLFTRTIIVNEKELRFSYKKGFVRKSAEIMQIHSLRTKKRFLENAYNLFLIVELPSGKTDRIKFTSLDENSDHFENYLRKEVFKEYADSAW